MRRVFFVALLVFGCLSKDAITRQDSRVSLSRDRSAYAFAFSTIVPKGFPKALVVRATPIAMPRLQGSVADWLAEFAAVPVPLREAVDRLQPSENAFDASLFAPQVHLVTEARIAQCFTGSDLEQNWAKFKETFDSDRWVAVSEVLLTDDRLNALLYAETHCGGLCGEGDYLWLHRASPDSAWHLGKRILRWIS